MAILSYAVWAGCGQEPADTPDTQPLLPLTQKRVNRELPSTPSLPSDKPVSPSVGTVSGSSLTKEGQQDTTAIRASIIKRLTNLLNDKTVDIQTAWQIMDDMRKSGLTATTLHRLFGGTSKDGPFSAHAIIIQTLAALNAQEVVPNIIGFLDDQDSLVRQAAVVAIGKLDAKNVIPKLEEMLTDPEAGVRLAAVRVLGDFGAQSATAKLVGLLNDKDNHVRQAAVNTLYKLEAREAAPAIIKLLSDQDNDVRNNVFEFLVKFAPREQIVSELVEILKTKEGWGYYAGRFLKKLDARESIPELISILGEWGNRRDADTAIMLIGSQEAGPGLIGLLDSEEYEVRKSAARLLGRLKISESIPELITLLNDEVSMVRNAAVIALGEINATAAIPAIQILLNDNEAYVRASATEALVKLGVREAIPELIKILENSGYGNRDWIIRRLPTLGVRESVPVLARLLETEKDHSVCSACADVLVEFSAKETLPDLIRLLKREDRDIQLEIAQAVGQLGSKESIPALMELYIGIINSEHCYYSETQTVEHALDELGASSIPELIDHLKDKNEDEDTLNIYDINKFNLSEVHSYLIQLMRDNDNYIRRLSIRSLAAIGFKGAIPDIIGLLKDEDTDIREAAADALGELEANEAIPTLKELINDEEPYVRSSVIAALAGLGDKDSIPALISLLGDKNPSIREFAVCIVLRLGMKEAVPELVKLLKDESQTVRGVAGIALVEFGAKNQVPPAITDDIKYIWSPNYYKRDIKRRARAVLKELGIRNE